MEVLDLSQLLKLIEGMPSYKRLLGELDRGGAKVRAGGLDVAKPYLIAALYHRMRRPMMVVTAQPENCRKLYEQLLAWCDSSRVMVFPEPEGFRYFRFYPM